MKLNQWIYKAGEEPQMIDRDDLPGFQADGWATRPNQPEEKTEEKTDKEKDDYFSLTQQATELGITVDGRWKAARLRDEITKAQDKIEV